MTRGSIRALRSTTAPALRIGATKLITDLTIGAISHRTNTLRYKSTFKKFDSVTLGAEAWHAFITNRSARHMEMKSLARIATNGSGTRETLGRPDRREFFWRIPRNYKQNDRSGNTAGRPDSIR